MQEYTMADKGMMAGGVVMSLDAMMRYMQTMEKRMDMMQMMKEQV